ncbi:MAG: hypothetical protein RJA58_711 [Pseudomonadota bacterium]|jgi:hypothetical protein
MSSDIEQALDEILSGVNALLGQAPSGRDLPRVEGEQAAPETPRESEAASQGHPDRQELFALLASLSSDSRRPYAEVARRLLLRFITARAQPVGPQAADARQVMISPLLLEATSRLFAAGARLDHSDAMSLFWDFSACPAASVRDLLGRFAPLLCPMQKDGRTLMRLPRFPERSRVQWRDHFDGKSTSSAQRSQQAAVIDQDNPGAELVTILWLGDGAFVPDHWCGVTFRDGQLCPVLHVDSRHRSIS